MTMRRTETTRPRLWRGILLVVLLVPVGFVLGMVVGAPLVPPGSGLAAGAIVVGYGLIGALAALVIGVVMAVRLPLPLLRRAAWVALTGLLAASLFLYARYRAVQAGRAEPGIEKPAPRPDQSQDAAPYPRPKTAGAEDAGQLY